MTEEFTVVGRALFDTVSLFSLLVLYRFVAFFAYVIVPVTSGLVCTTILRGFYFPLLNLLLYPGVKSYCDEQLADTLSTMGYDYCLDIKKRCFLLLFVLVSSWLLAFEPFTLVKLFSFIVGVNLIFSFCEKDFLRLVGNFTGSSAC